MKAIIYARVSTDSQETERQIVDCKTYCKNNNFEIVDVLEETGSGYKNDRPELDRVLKYVKSGGVDVVVTYELSRLGRNNDVLNTIKTFDEHKVALHTIVYGIRTNPTVESSFLNPFIGILVALSNSEAALFKKRSSSGIRKIAMDGKALGSTNQPYGYVKKEVRGYLHINETEAEVVKNIFKLYLDGNGTLKIRDILNKTGVPTRNNKKWNEKVVYDILNNTMYIGKRRFKGEKFDLPQFRIIDDETFNEVQHRLHSNYSKLGNNTKHKYLINRKKTKIYCGVCGKTYFPYKRSNGEDNRYICISKRYGESCGNTGISITKFEKAVQIVLLKHYSDILLKKLDNSILRGQIMEVEEYINSLEKSSQKLLKSQITMIKDRYTSDLPAEAFTAALNEVIKERDSILNELNNSKIKLVELKQTYDNILNLKNIEKQVNSGVNIPEDKVNLIIKKLTITKVDQPLNVFSKSYDKVVEVELVAGIENNSVRFMISQREDFLFDLPTMKRIKLNVQKVASK
jgi:DNA invertase Pin-like site-specific DNA recombinase